MRQPDGLIVEDREGVVYHGRAGRRPYLAALPIFVALACIAVLGAAGPHSSPDRSRGSDVAAASITHAPTPTALPSPSASPWSPSPSPTAAMWTPSPSPQAIWTPGPTPTPRRVPGVANLDLGWTDLHTFGLGTGSNPMAVLGSRLIFFSGFDLLIEDPSSSNPNAAGLVASPACGQIVSAAATSERVIFAEMLQSGASPDTLDCPGTNPTDWRIVVLDLSNSGTSTVASGSFGHDASWDDQAFPRVAIADSVYAFSRPASEAGKADTVEVHAISGGKRLFAAEAQGEVGQLLVADSRLVVVSRAHRDGGWIDAPGGSEVSATDGWDKPLETVGWATGTVSMSRDGKRLAFAACNDTGECSGIRVIEEQGSHDIAVSHPVIAVAISSGQLPTLAWVAESADGTKTDLVFRNEQWPGGAAIVGIPPPTWLALDGSFLVWTATDPDEYRNVSVYEVDLATANLHE